MMKHRLQLSLEAGSPPVIRALGELNYENCQQLGDLIGRTLKASQADVDLALGGLDFVDSSGLRILIIGAQDASHVGGMLRIVSLTPQLDHVLTVSGVRHLFDVIGTPLEIRESIITPPVEMVPDEAFELPSAVHSCCDGRDRICAFAAGMGFSQMEIDDIRLAAGEALSNAVRHGDCRGRSIKVNCKRINHGMRVVLEYPSECFDPEGVPIPNMDDPPIGGMGIHFMKLVMDRVDYEFRGDLAVLTLEKCLVA